MADQKFKSKISAEAGVALPAESASKVLQLDGSGNVQSSSVTTTELGYVSGVTSAIQTQLGNKISSSEKGANNGVATLDAGGKVPASQLPNSVMEFKGAWDASSNTPTLADGSGNAGDVYRVSAAGSQDLGSGSQSYVIGDWVMYNGSIWQKSPGTDAVLSVNGATGAVTVNAVNQLTGDVTAGPASGSQSVAATIAAGAVSNSKMANMAAHTIKGNNSGSSAAPSDLTATQVTAELDVVVGDSGSGGTKGLVPAPAAGDAAAGKFLKADGTFAVPSGTGINQLTGDVTAGPGSGSQAATIAASAVTNSKLANMAAHTFKGNNTGSSAAPSDLTATQATAELDVVVGDSGSGGTKGLVPAPAAGDAAAGKFLKADGTFAVPSTGASAGDITETSFSAANNQVAAANVTGLAFANGTVRSFNAQVSVYINATASLYEVFELKGIQKGSSWDMAISSVGDNSGITFSITNAGQVQYTSSNISGFTSDTMKFRAQTTSV